MIDLNARWDMELRLTCYLSYLGIVILYDESQPAYISEARNTEFKHSDDI